MVVAGDLLQLVHRRGRRRPARCRLPLRRPVFVVPRAPGVVRQEAVEHRTALVVIVVAPVAMVVAWWPLAVFRCRLFFVVVVLDVAVEAREQGLPVAAPREEQGLPVAAPLTSVVALHTRLRTAQCRTLLLEESAAHVQMVCSVDVVSPLCLV